MSSPSCSIKMMLCSFGFCSSSCSSAGYQQLRLSPPISPFDGSAGQFRSFSSSLSKKRRSLIPVVLNSTDQVYFVDPHILDHWLFQDLLRKAMKQWHQQTTVIEPHSNRKERRRRQSPIFLDCDAILFEFFIWLVEKDDPCLRDLDLNDLMEFYSGTESTSK